MIDRIYVGDIATIKHVVSLADKQLDSIVVVGVVNDVMQTLKSFAYIREAQQHARSLLQANPKATIEYVGKAAEQV